MSSPNRDSFLLPTSTNSTLEPLPPTLPEPKPAPRMAPVSSRTSVQLLSNKEPQQKRILPCRNPSFHPPSSDPRLELSAAQTPSPLEPPELAFDKISDIFRCEREDQYGVQLPGNSNVKVNGPRMMFTPPDCYCRERSESINKESMPSLLHNPRRSSQIWSTLSFTFKGPAPDMEDRASAFGKAYTDFCVKMLCSEGVESAYEINYPDTEGKRSICIRWSSEQDRPSNMSRKELLLALGLDPDDAEIQCSVDDSTSSEDGSLGLVARSVESDECDVESQSSVGTQKDSAGLQKDKPRATEEDRVQHDTDMANKERCLNPEQGDLSDDEAASMSSDAWYPTDDATILRLLEEDHMTEAVRALESVIEASHVKHNIGVPFDVSCCISGTHRAEIIEFVLPDDLVSSQARADLHFRILHFIDVMISDSHEYQPVQPQLNGWTNPDTDTCSFDQTTAHAKAFRTTFWANGANEKKEWIRMFMSESFITQGHRALRVSELVEHNISSYQVTVSRLCMGRLGRVDLIFEKEAGRAEAIKPSNPKLAVERISNVSDNSD